MSAQADYALAAARLAPISFSDEKQRQAAVELLAGEMRITRESQEEIERLGRIIDAFQPLEEQIALLDTYQANRQTNEVGDGEEARDCVRRYQMAVSNLEMQRDVLFAALEPFAAELRTWGFKPKEFQEIRDHHLNVEMPNYTLVGYEKAGFTWNDLERAAKTYDAVIQTIGLPAHPVRFGWLRRKPNRSQTEQIEQFFLSLIKNDPQEDWGGRPLIAVWREQVIGFMKGWSNDRLDEIETAYVVHPVLAQAQSVLEQAQSELLSVHLQFGDRKHALEHSLALRMIDEFSSSVEEVS